MKRNLCLVKAKISPLTPGPSLDCFLILQLEEQGGSIKIDLSEIIRDILFSEKEEEDLLDQKVRLYEALFDLSLKIKHLLHTQPSRPSMLVNES